MREATSAQPHTNGPLNYVDYDADERIAEQLAQSNRLAVSSERRSFREILTRNFFGAIGLALIALSAAGTAALVTWSVNDPSLNYAVEGAVQNALGVPGAIVSDLLMQFFGLGSIALLLVISIWGWRLLFGQRLVRLKRRFLYATATVLLAAGMVASMPVTAKWPLPMGLGGVVGDVMIWLPVAAFGSHFAGIIGWINAAILGGLSLGTFVLATWSYAGIIGRARLQEAEPEPTASPLADGEIEEDGQVVDRGWAGIALGAAAHVALSGWWQLRRMLKSAVGGLARMIVRRSDGAQSSAHVQDNQMLARGGYARHGYEPIGEEVDYGHHLEPHFEPVSAGQSDDGFGAPDSIDPYLDVPAEDFDQNAYVDEPAPVVRTRTAAPKAVRPESRVKMPRATVKKGARGQREAQPDLLSTGEYELPPLHLLSEPDRKRSNGQMSADALEQNARLLEGVLEDFGVRGEIINVHPGPVVTLYELEPAPGIKSSRVIGLADDIARSMSAIAARVAVIPGRNAIGIELPNARRETVYLRELLDSTVFEKSKAKLAMCLGKTIGGEPVIADLAKMPHLLVAGTTGSGKSVSINTMILSLLYRMKPEECRLIMIDPKMLELSVYDGIPHLLTPVVTDPKKAVVALKWTVREMEDRYKKMSKLGVRNIDGFNARVKQAAKKREVITRTVQTGFDHETGEAIYEQEELNLEPMPYMVVIIDEMADLMMVAGKEIEGTVQRLAQMARAAGIHVIMATQRPSVDVITGTIKANFPTRISFQVTSKIDSRTILGEQGAEQLLGMGDMLYMAGGGRIQRVHGPFVDDAEVEQIVEHLHEQGVPEYLDSITDEAEVESSAVLDAMTGGGSGDGEDSLYDQAVAIVLRDKKVSTSYVQRRLSIGYNKAASIIERMEEEGVISAANHAGKREILVGNSEDTI